MNPQTIRNFSGTPQHSLTQQTSCCLEGAKQGVSNFALNRGATQGATSSVKTSWVNPAIFGGGDPSRMSQRRVRRSDRGHLSAAAPRSAHRRLHAPGALPAAAGSAAADLYGASNFERSKRSKRWVWIGFEEGLRLPVSVFKGICFCSDKVIK